MNNGDIIKYYNDCEIDYKLLWRLNKCHNMHYGYFEKNTFSLSKAILKMNDQILKYIDKDKELLVLDAGCGYGGTSIYLSHKTNAKFECITIVDRQIKIGKDLVEEYGLRERINFSNQDYTNTDFPDNTFDIVFGIESVCHSQKEKFLKEAFRILKPNGKLIILDGYNSKEKKDYTDKEKKIMNKWNEGWAVASLETSNYFIENSKKIGFKNVKYLNITNNVKRTSTIMYIAHFPALLVDFVGRVINVRTKYNTGNVRAAKFQYIGMKMGLWEYGEFYAEKNENKG